jgi:hypothetical protein
MKENKKSVLEKNKMSTVRLDRDAFRRGVDDVLTLAPLRDAVRVAAGAFATKSEKPSAKTTSIKTTDGQRDGSKKSSAR